MKITLIIFLISLSMGLFTNLTTVVNLVKKTLDTEKVLERPENIKKNKSKSIYEFPLKTLDGKEFNLAQYKGKKIVILNVASECGYTPQYADWQKYYDENSDKVVVLGFPANNFGGQEPGSNEEIATFCSKNYGVTFPIMEKISVKGSDKAPIYQWLTDKSMNGWNEKEPTWNFCKYLINEKGQLTHFFNSDIKPNSLDFQVAVK
ncbi:MAG: glutathione peroxidase [Bacteroidota bacterium]